MPVAKELKALGSHFGTCPIGDNRPELRGVFIALNTSKQNLDESKWGSLEDITTVGHAGNKANSSHRRKHARATIGN